MRPTGLLPLWCIVALGGCTPLGVWVYQDPAFEVSRVRLDTKQSADSTVMVALQVWNPNDFEISTSRFELRLRLDGQTVGHFERDSVIPVPRSAAATTVSLSFIPSGGDTRRKLESFRTGTHRFVVEGRAVMKTPIGDRRVRVAHAGDMAFGVSGEAAGGGDAGGSSPDQSRSDRYPAVWRGPESKTRR